MDGMRSCHGSAVVAWGSQTVRQDCLAGPVALVKSESELISVQGEKRIVGVDSKEKVSFCMGSFAARCASQRPIQRVWPHLQPCVFVLSMNYFRTRKPYKTLEILKTLFACVVRCDRSRLAAVCETTSVGLTGVGSHIPSQGCLCRTELSTVATNLTQVTPSNGT